MLFSHSPLTFLKLSGPEFIASEKQKEAGEEGEIGGAGHGNRGNVFLLVSSSCRPHQVGHTGVGTTVWWD